MSQLIPVEVIADKILLIRNQKVLIDRNLAKLYGVQTKVLNQAVKRNIKRFPEDFMFQLNKDEKNEVVTNCDHLAELKFSPQLPYVFTESGVAMLSSVLNSDKAIEINIQIMRAFIRLRKMLIDNQALKYAVEGLERRMGKTERDIQIAFKAIKSLIEPPKIAKTKRKMGFAPAEKNKK